MRNERKQPNCYDQTKVHLKVSIKSKAACNNRRGAPRCDAEDPDTDIREASVGHSVPSELRNLEGIITLNATISQERNPAGIGRTTGKPYSDVTLRSPLIRSTSYILHVRTSTNDSPFRNSPELCGIDQVAVLSFPAFDMSPRSGGLDTAMELSFS